MLPEGWRQVPLHTVAEVRTGLSKNASREGVTLKRPYIRVANVQDGTLDLTDVKEIDVPASQTARYTLQAGDLLLIEGNGNPENLGRSCLWRGQVPDAVHQNHVFVVRALPNGELLPEFLEQQTQSQYGRDYFLSCAKGSTGLSSLNSSQLKNFPLVIPPPAEQRRIANILSTWDQAFAATERMLANSKRCTRDLMSSLLSGHLRFPGLSEKWRYFDLDAIFERVTRKNTTHNTNVLTISAEYGLISQRDYFNKSVASANLSGYTLLHRHDFAYNKSYSAAYPMGAIKPLLAHQSGVVSSLYLCFRLRDDVDADFDFFRHYFEAGLLNQEIEGIAQEGARNHGLLNVSVTDFFKLQLHIPCAPEQRRIAEVINVARAEEARLEAQIRALQQEKAALMSQLLTGKRRVKLPDVETEASA